MMIGALMGLMAGYLVLCMIDLRYDVLNLIPDEEPEPKRVEARIGPAGAPRQNQPPKPARQRSEAAPRKKKTPPPNIVLGNPNIRQFNPQLANAAANLPAQLPLPIRATSNQPKILVNLPWEPADVELALLSDQENPDGQLSLQKVDQNQWTVRSVGDIHTDIAKFTLPGAALRFEWLDPPTEAMAPLRNSILKISGDRHDHFAALRAPTEVEPITFDLTKSIQRTVCDCADLPDAKKLRADILESEEFPPFEVELGELRGLEIGDQRVLKYRNANATTTIRFVTFKELPGIELETRYELPSGANDTLNVRDGSRKLENLRKSVKLKNDPALKEQLDSLERIVQLAIQLHEKVKLRFRLYCVVDGHEIELVTAQ
jgi:hypothetical protein